MKKDSCSKIIPLIMWSVLTLFYFYQFIARSSFITVLTYDFMRYFSIDAGGIGMLGNSYYLVYTLMQIPAGIIIDKYSTRKIAILASLSCAIGMFFLVLTRNIYVAIVGQMLTGLGAAFSFILILKTITNWFAPRMVPIMTSYAISLGCLGPVIGGPAVAMLAKHTEWTHLIFAYSAVGFVLVFVLFLILRDKVNDEKNIQEKTPVSDALKIIFTSPHAWILAVFSMALYAPLSALGDMWGVAFIKKAYNADVTTAAFANNMLYVGVVIGAPIFAWIATIMNSYKKPMIIGMCAAAVGMTIVVMSTTLPIYAVFALFFIIGFACGAMLSYPLALALFHPSMGATVSGFVNMICMVSGVILMPAIGHTMDFFWDGIIEDGIKVYSIHDFRCGMALVVLFLIVGVITSLFIKDKSPNGGR